MFRLVLRAFTVAMMLAALVQPAFAHAQLLSTAPADGAVLDAAPEELELYFNEPVTPLALRLIGPDGATRDVLPGVIGGETVTIAMPESVGDGTQILSYRVVSADGHPIGGSLVFSVGQVTDTPTAPATDPLSSAALWLGKALLFICLFFGIGGAAFQALAPLPAAARRISLVLSAGGLIIAPLTLGLQGLDALALPLAALVDPAAWAAGMSTSYGLTAGVATAGFLLASLALLLSGTSGAVLGLAAAAIAALSIALSGHASAASPQILTRPMVFLHMAGVLFWAGALLPLWHLLRDRTGQGGRALALFSRSIPYTVAPLVLSGIGLAVIQLGMPGSAWLTGYGIILAIKLGLLVALFGLALWNRFWLTQPALAGDELASRRLRRSIGSEIVLILIILALVAGWRFTPPPRALAIAPPVVVAAEPLLVHLMDDELMVMASVTPGAAGPVTLDITVSDFEGTPREAQSLAVTLSSPTLGIEPIKRDATPTDAGWQVEQLTIPIAGDWVMDVELRLSRFELRKYQSELAVP